MEIPLYSPGEFGLRMLNLFMVDSFQQLDQVLRANRKYFEYFCIFLIDHVLKVLDEIHIYDIILYDIEDFYNLPSMVTLENEISEVDLLESRISQLNDDTLVFHLHLPGNFITNHVENLRPEVFATVFVHLYTTVLKDNGINVYSIENGVIKYDLDKSRTINYIQAHILTELGVHFEDDSESPLYKTSTPYYRTLLQDYHQSLNLVDDFPNGTDPKYLYGLINWFSSN